MATIFIGSVWAVCTLWDGCGMGCMLLTACVPVPAAAVVAYLQSLQALVTEVQAKTAALLEAERRFAELEGVMQRMVARASGAA